MLGDRRVSRVDEREARPARCCFCRFVNASVTVCRLCTQAFAELEAQKNDAEDAVVVAENRLLKLVEAVKDDQVCLGEWARAQRRERPKIAAARAFPRATAAAAAALTATTPRNVDETSRCRYR
jgi:hypothetical protein